MRLTWAVIQALIFSVMPRMMGLSSQPAAFTSNLAWLLLVAVDSCGVEQRAPQHTPDGKSGEDGGRGVCCIFVNSPLHQKANSYFLVEACT